MSTILNSIMSSVKYIRQNVLPGSLSGAELMSDGGIFRATSEPVHLFSPLSIETSHFLNNFVGPELTLHLSSTLDGLQKVMAILIYPTSALLSTSYFSPYSETRPSNLFYIALTQKIFEIYIITSLKALEHTVAYFLTTPKPVNNEETIQYFNTHISRLEKLTLNEKEKADIKLLKEDIQMISDEFECPIGYKLMDNPTIVIPSQKIYDRESIELWLRNGQNKVDPYTATPLSGELNQYGQYKELELNIPLKQEIDLNLNNINKQLFSIKNRIEERINKESWFSIPFLRC